VTWTAQLLGWGARRGDASAYGGQPRWVAAALSQEEDDGADGPLNGPKDRVGSECCWANFGKTKINNTKPVGLRGVLGLNQNGLLRK
jgi:hypothetical protein